MSPNQRCSPYGLLPSGLDHHTQPTGWRRRCCEWRWEGGSPARGMEPWRSQECRADGRQDRWAQLCRRGEATWTMAVSAWNRYRTCIADRSMEGRNHAIYMTGNHVDLSWITTGINFVVARCSSHWTENERWSDDHILLVVAKLRSLIRLPLVVRAFYHFHPSLSHWSLSNQFILLIRLVIFSH